MKTKLILIFCLINFFLKSIENAKVATVTNDVFLKVKSSSAQDYEKNFEEILKPYILGVADSFMTANAYLKMKYK